MNTKILLLHLRFHKASESTLISPPAMLLAQLGLQEVFINNLSGHGWVFNNTAKKSGFGIKGDSNCKIYFMNHFQTLPKHRDSLVGYSPSFILFLIDS
jgi:hypothetical protein